MFEEALAWYRKPTFRTLPGDDDPGADFFHGGRHSFRTLLD